MNKITPDQDGVVSAIGLCGDGDKFLYHSKLRGDHFLGGPRFSAPIRTSPGAHPASYTKGTRPDLFRG